MKLPYITILLIILICFSLSYKDIRKNNKRKDDSCLIFSGFKSVSLQEFDSLINSTYRTLTCLHSKVYIEKIFIDLKSFHKFNDDIINFCCKEIDTFDNTIETKFQKSLKTIKSQLKGLLFSNEYIESKGLQLVFFLGNNNYFDNNCQDKEPDEFMDIDLGPNLNEEKPQVQEVKKTSVLKKVIDGGKNLLGKISQKGKNFFKKLFKCFKPSSSDDEGEKNFRK